MKKLIILVSLFVLFGCSSYDPVTPDTDNNRKGFETHFEFKPDKDVKNVYYYIDGLGIDIKYQLSFECEQKVVDKIVKELNLVVNDDKMGVSLANDFDWWNDEYVKQLTIKYWKVNETNDYYKFLWFDSENKKAYYLEFST